MPASFVEKEICGKTFRILPLPAKLGSRLLFRLSRVAGPAIASGAFGAGSGKEDFFERLAKSLADSADLDSLFSDLQDAFADSTKVRRGDGAGFFDLAEGFDGVFQGDYFSLARWFVESMRLNYEGFFLELKVSKGGSPRE
jgi:hypothetical protein